MRDMTLREMCNTLGVSRRAAQGYEMAGLVSASGRNKYGRLLYDKKAQKKFELIRLIYSLALRSERSRSLLMHPR